MIIISKCNKLTHKEYKPWYNWVGRWSTGNCARNWNLTIPPNGICINESVRENEMRKIIFFKNINRSPNPGQKTKKKKRSYRIVDFPVQADHWVKIKESEKGDNCLDFARELRKLRNIKVTVIPIVVGSLGTVSKNLEKRLNEREIRGRIETIKTTALLKSARILRWITESWEDLLSLRFRRNTTS